MFRQMMNETERVFLSYGTNGGVALLAIERKQVHCSFMEGHAGIGVVWRRFLRLVQFFLLSNFT